MNFPFYIPVGPWNLHPHLVFEALAYFIGFRVYLYTRDKERIPFDQALWVIVGATLGAAVGSKFLYWLEDPAQILAHWQDLTYLMGGKTIVGGLLGGLIGVEWTKKRIGWTRSTGDDFVYPLIVGMILGRIGCFLTGLDDHTHGLPTHWWTGIDYGDGILRHPTQLYEIAFLLLLALWLPWIGRRWSMPEGGRFQLFLCSYLIFRLFIDFIKPVPHVYGGLSAIQLAALAGIAYYTVKIGRWYEGRHRHAP